MNFCPRFPSRAWYLPADHCSSPCTPSSTSAPLPQQPCHTLRKILGILKYRPSTTFASPALEFPHLWVPRTHRSPPPLKIRSPRVSFEPETRRQELFTPLWGSICQQMKRNWAFHSAQFQQKSVLVCCVCLGNDVFCFGNNDMLQKSLKPGDYLICLIDCLGNVICFVLEILTIKVRDTWFFCFFFLFGNAYLSQVPVICFVLETLT